MDNLRLHFNNNSIPALTFQQQLHLRLHPMNNINTTCNVTNKGIQTLLESATVTLECLDSTCLFDFKANRETSFNCTLKECKDLQCKFLNCECIKDAFLCGRDGSIDLSDWFSSDQGPKGPTQFTCRDSHCSFTEANMNNLISQFFGDPCISLDCNILHVTQDSHFLLFSGLIVFFFLSCLLFYRKHRHYRPIPSDSDADLILEHTSCSLSFSNISYSIADKQVLSNIIGHVSNGQVLAIMGSSGAGIFN